jgi:high-affinity nickel-transport protein
MGNFSINHYAGIRVDRDAVEVRYIVDLAEIPTYQEVQDAGIVTQSGDASLPPYLARQAALWVKGLQLEINGGVIALETVSKAVIFPPGAGGLPTMKIGIVYRGALRRSAVGTMHLHYLDGNFPGHAGWKEIVVTAGEGVTLEPNQPYRIDRSAQLTNYPTDLLNSPPQDLEATLTYSIAAPPVAPATNAERPLAKTVAQTYPDLTAPRKGVQSVSPTMPAAAQSASPKERIASSPMLLEANKQTTPRSRFTELMTAPKMSLWYLITAAFLAAGLGAMHALEPGHGKTIVAAYLVGSRGRTRHAIGLGALVTLSHTAGVYLLGAIVLYASKYIIPERIYPWLSISSGLIISALAGYLFLRAYTGVKDSTDGEDGVLHSHWYSKRAAVPAAASPALLASASPNNEQTIPLRQLLVLGITGGIIPCPAALVVLLSAVSLHRIGLGLFLIVAFSLGLAAVLIGIGIAMVRARHMLSRWKNDAPWMQRWLPMASTAAMLVAGLAIAATALPATGLSFRLTSLSDHQLPSFAAIILLGLFLGMRHSTDPDHVVAVSTIVARERSIKQGAMIGMMWGFGHTITIFAVGAAIILFKLTIPPRLGLSMEMAVAGMLILLGILNLTGLLQRLTERLTPMAWANGEGKTSAPDAGKQSSSFVNRFGYYQLLRPLAIGLVHGLAGSAAVALLVLSMIPSPAWAVMYLVIFGLGTVAGMMLMTTAMAVPIALTGKRSTRYLTVASGLVSICFGLFLVYQIGFVDGLFTSHVHWTPS